MNQRVPISETAFVQMVVWEVPESLQGSQHLFKYRLAYVVDDECVIRFDNEVGKGDHIHLGSKQINYEFSSIDQLLEDFWHRVDNWRQA